MDMFKKIAAMVSWAVTSLVTINLGLNYFFNFDFFMTPFFINNFTGRPALLSLLFGLILLSGIVSLVFYVMALMGNGCCSKGKSSCGC